jgi:PPOX class probable F420-dependent enzyme
MRVMTKLLPLASEPYIAPTDRDMLPSERREFVRTHRTCIFGYGRRDDGPAMSVVYYVPTDGDDLLISTMAARGKARAAARNPKISLCVLDERWPFSYLQVYADATVERDTNLVIDVMMAIAARMSGQELGEDARPVVAAMAAEEERVVLRCRPYATFAQPPRHLHRNDQAETLTHWVSPTIAWDASDEAPGAT